MSEPCGNYYVAGVFSSDGLHYNISQHYHLMYNIIGYVVHAFFCPKNSQIVLAQSQLKELELNSKQRMNLECIISPLQKWR